MPVYEVKKRLVSIGRDYDVQDENGKAVFRLDGKIGFARRFVIKDGEGKSLLTVREKLLCIDPMFVIKQGAETVAVVRRRSYNDSVTAKFEVEINGKVEMEATGSFLRDGVKIKRPDGPVGNVSRKPLMVLQEIFHVSATSTENQSLVLAIAMSIVEMTSFRGQDRN